MHEKAQETQSGVRESGKAAEMRKMLAEGRQNAVGRVLKGVETRGAKRTGQWEHTKTALKCVRKVRSVTTARRVRPI
ncbi:hypothetical protein L596_015996 [Steinernema carpocapsae]|uniref:Uncharacterized protein n=1 Tax=Steinernema carpocapsae TaxID=34508 RepID=A0A4U5NGP6_STECR|nr:hypothetical protein L596_015996 [Steinernema carpocapsae]